ncbi:DMT family transporter [Pseudoclavibacter terrae]|uniref:EamA family transporter n=1 Tax=Pseudoclavibacter terrae TaxID=1530195 RepID=A0A7J5AXD3_9MICO|nr:EamA family transporter [Pseudoclavibacter terrae]KAB1636102.1 EamA family transporter [Pseudoclavibacter terrae]
MTRRSAIPVLVLSALIMGTASTAAALMPASIPGTTIGAATLGAGGLLMFVAFRGSALQVLRDRHTRHWVLSGGLLVACYALAYYSSVQYAGAAVSTVVNLGSAPLFAAAMEWITGTRRLSLQWALGTAVSVVGLVLLSFFADPGAASDTPTDAADMTAGIALAVLSGLLYAGYTLTSKKALDQRPDAPGVMGATFGVGGFLLLPLLALNFETLLRTPATIGLGLYLAIGPVLIGFWLFGLGLRYVDARTATTITLIEPVLASLLAVIVIHEAIAAPGWIGIAATVVGLYVATKKS